MGASGNDSNQARQVDSPILTSASEDINTVKKNIKMFLQQYPENTAAEIGIAFPDLDKKEIEKVVAVEIANQQKRLNAARSKSFGKLNTEINNIDSVKIPEVKKQIKALQKKMEPMAELSPERVALQPELVKLKTELDALEKLKTQLSVKRSQSGGRKKSKSRRKKSKSRRKKSKSRRKKSK